MTLPVAAQPFMARAERYFSRTSISQPVFLDDDRIALLSDHSGTKQLGVVARSTGDLQAVTSYGEGLMSLLASSATGRIVFGMDLGGNERQQLYRLDQLDSQPVKLTTSDASFYEPGGLSDDGTAVIYRTNDRDEGTFDIVVQRIDSGDRETWLQDGGQVTPTDLHGERALVILRNNNMDADVLLVGRGGEVRNLTAHDGEQWVYDARFDRRGDGVYILSNLGRDYVALIYQQLASGERRTIHEAAWDIDLFAVSPDGAWIALAVNEGGAHRPLLIPAAGGDPIEVGIDAPRGVIDRFSWSPDSSSVAFGVSTIERPSLVMTSSLDGRTTVVADGDVADPPPTVTPETITYVTWDGREVPGFFFRPEGDGPFPALVEIHGGPEGQRKLDYGTNGASLQYLVSLGIAVLALNVRGSTGYGKEYCHLDDREKRLDAVKDVAAAAKWLQSRDDILGDQIAVYGVSYGGFMTLSALVRYPEIWAAGVEMVGMSHLGAFLERTGPWRRAHRESEYGSLATDREMLERVSPLPLVDRISAPLLVFHGRQDARVPLYESEQIAEAVRQRGLDVTLRIYDDEGHGFLKRPNILDAWALIGEFLTRHLMPGAGA